MATATGDNLRSLIFKVDDDNGKASLSVLDQLSLPHVTKYDEVNNVEDAWDAVSLILSFCARLYYYGMCIMHVRLANGYNIHIVTLCCK